MRERKKKKKRGREREEEERERQREEEKEEEEEEKEKEEEEEKEEDQHPRTKRHVHGVQKRAPAATREKALGRRRRKKEKHNNRKRRRRKRREWEGRREGEWSNEPVHSTGTQKTVPQLYTISNAELKLRVGDDFSKEVPRGATTHVAGKRECGIQKRSGREGW